MFGGSEGISHCRTGQIKFTITDNPPPRLDKAHSAGCCQRMRICRAHGLAVCSEASVPVRCQWAGRTDPRQPRRRRPKITVDGGRGRDKPYPCLEEIPLNVVFEDADLIVDQQARLA